MADTINRCRVTIIKRTVNKDLVEDYLEEKYSDLGTCDSFKDGQEIIIDDYYNAPKGFCSSAWADIRKDVMMAAFGANIPGIKQKGTVITACRDWFRPVYFKVERMDENAGAGSPDDG